MANSYCTNVASPYPHHSAGYNENQQQLVQYHSQLQFEPNRVSNIESYGSLNQMDQNRNTNQHSLINKDIDRDANTEQCGFECKKKELRRLFGTEYKPKIRKYIEVIHLSALFVPPLHYKHNNNRIRSL